MPDASERLLWGLLALPMSALLPSPLHNRPNRRAFPLLGSGLRADVPLLEHAAVATHVLSLQSSRWDNRGAESLQMSLKRRVVLVFQCVMKQIRLLVPQNTGLAIWRFGWHVQEVRVAIRIVDKAPASMRRFKAHDAALRHALVGPSVAGRLLRECDFRNRVEGMRGSVRAR